MLNEVLVHFDTSLLLRRSIWLLRERASRFINSLISSPVRPEGERCTAFALARPSDRNFGRTRSRARNGRDQNSEGKLRCRESTGRTEGRANELRRGGGYETHFGLGAKVDLIEFCLSVRVRPSDSASGSGSVFDALPRRFHISFFWRAQREGLPC